jgi:hypothetical protein
LLLAMERSDVDFYAGSLGALLMAFNGFVVISNYGVIGAAWSRSISQTIVVSFGCYMVSRMGFSLPFRGLLRLFTAAVICSAAARLAVTVIPGAAGLPLAVLLGGVLYILAIRFFRALTTADILSLRSLVQALPSPVRTVANALLDFVGRRELPCP